jgi:hypothetical protein
MRERDVETTEPKLGSGMKKTGGAMAGLGFACLIIGRVLVSVLFPEREDKMQLLPWIWFVLVPVWLLILVGAVLFLIGWARGRKG